ncbi:MAG: hypothetical protein DHS20C10_09220 [marine bacterium B5-7]|nr:MAG: hypothetical protein DHS20C10_09220 [marine bacterium B5-7]
MPETKPVETPEKKADNLFQYMQKNGAFQDVFEEKRQGDQSARDFFDVLVEGAGGIEMAEKLFNSGRFNFEDPAVLLPAFRGNPPTYLPLPTTYFGPDEKSPWFDQADFEHFDRGHVKQDLIAAYRQSSHNESRPLPDDVLSRLIDAFMWRGAKINPKTMTIARYDNADIMPYDEVLDISTWDDKNACTCYSLTKVQPSELTQQNLTLIDIFDAASWVQQQLQQRLEARKSLLARNRRAQLPQQLAPVLCAVPGFNEVFNQRNEQCANFSTPEAFARHILETVENPTQVLTSAVAGRFSFAAYTRQSADVSLFLALGIK